LPKEGEGRHEIVGVKMAEQAVIRFEKGAPPMAQAEADTCGIPYANQATLQIGSGQAWVTVSRGGTVLWKFLAVRPSASVGTNGSGIELRMVSYRGRLVLYRANVPIVNVKNEHDACGPYRNWQKEEGMFQADGVDGAPGFRMCSAPASTILDTGSDTGNYLGVAVYVQGEELVLVSELEAGWYRYVSEWRLHADGTIRPRFGFTAVNTSSCVCMRHYHHAYWRFDFDIRTAANNVVSEFNDPPIVASSNWHTITYETQRSRNPARHRKWKVENASGGYGYEIIPGPEDGVATESPDWPFPRGDVWVLRSRRTEMDDGVVAYGPPFEAGIDGFVNRESIYKQDIVVWYAGHVIHDFHEDPPGTYGHVVGPTLAPVNW
jgi:hypothetical protein